MENTPCQGLKYHGVGVSPALLALGRWRAALYLTQRSDMGQTRRRASRGQVPEWETGRPPTEVRGCRWGRAHPCVSPTPWLPGLCASFFPGTVRLERGRWTLLGSLPRELPNPHDNFRVPCTDQLQCCTSWVWKPQPPRCHGLGTQHLKDKPVCWSQGESRSFGIREGALPPCLFLPSSFWRSKPPPFGVIT